SMACPSVSKKSALGSIPGTWWATQDQPLAMVDQLSASTGECWPPTMECCTPREIEIACRTKRVPNKMEGAIRRTVTATVLTTEACDGDRRLASRRCMG